jgi:hypothetical protein
MEEQLITTPSANPIAELDPVVCFCFRLTEKQLRNSYSECKNLDDLKCKTRAGTACRGCLSSLTAMFNQDDNWHASATRQSSCVYSGQSLMKGLIVSLDGLETQAVAANSPAPQIVNCNLDATVNYVIVDGAGQIVSEGTQNLPTNKNFIFDTATANFKKPFVGQIFYQLDRKNRASGRLSTRWYSKSGVAATHENGSTGRPRVFVPFGLDTGFISGPNKIYLAVVNPHAENTSFELSLFGKSGTTFGKGSGVLGAYNTIWVDIDDVFVNPLRNNWPTQGAYIKLETTNLIRDLALSCYVFIHNQNTGSWSCQHL